MRREEKRRTHSCFDSGKIQETIINNKKGVAVSLVVVVAAVKGNLYVAELYL